jgi:hypothetical protein
MGMVSEDYLRMANEKMGGVNDAALESLVYWNNPLALKHWTMNVVELLLIVGAVMAFMHARQVWRERSDPTNLGLFWATIVYLFVTEVPLYFPQLLGLDVGLVFMHNEFSAGILYNQTPLYIIALYPALIYPCYVLVQETGLFARKGGLWTGALCVGFLHSCFYEIFDHFGPQFTWWVWNIENPLVSNRLYSVPWTSVIVFSLTPPMVATVLVRSIVGRYVASRKRQSLHASLPIVVLLTLVTGVLIPVVNSFLPTSSIATVVTDRATATVLYAAVLVVAGVVSLLLFLRFVSAPGQVNGTASRGLIARYPWNFLIVYLAVFLGLWLYALPELIVAQDGITARGTPVGFLPYVIFCFLVCGLVLYRTHGRVATSPRGQLART